VRHHASIRISAKVFYVPIEKRAAPLLIGHNIELSSRADSESLHPVQAN
jgi:hypothetical protein